MQTDRKTIFLLLFLFFLGNGSGSENAGSKTEPKYTDVRKRSNMVRNSTETIESRELKLEYHTSLYSQIIATHKAVVRCLAMRKPKAIWLSTYEFRRICCQPLSLTVIENLYEIYKIFQGVIE
jgi:hypothetical protein